ncbi:unnamed protein product [Prorocentrum cordatum]|uniref:Gluconokinase n=1 Tax=Prorocentrum cordatum TaxID=2364126 RepID=A0ABN9W552_9DINO|nr:unnamed protein product [Polarella glacialis]
MAGFSYRDLAVCFGWCPKLGAPFRRREHARRSIGEEKRASDAPPLVYFFGLPGAGKNHCGEMLAREFGYVFRDGDRWLPEDLRDSLARGQGFTPEQRDRYASTIAAQIARERDAESSWAREHARAPRPLAVAQATFKRKHRDLIHARPPRRHVLLGAGGRRHALRPPGPRGQPGGRGPRQERMAKDFEPPGHDEAAAVVDNSVTLAAATRMPSVSS